LPLHAAVLAVGEGSSVANMLTPRHPARMQVAKITTLIDVSLTYHLRSAQIAPTGRNRPKNAMLESLHYSQGECVRLRGTCRAGLYRLPKGSWSSRRPARAQYSSRGQRPRKVPSTVPDPERVAFTTNVGCRCYSSSTPSGSTLVGARLPGGGCPRLLYRSPAGIKDKQSRRVLPQPV